MRDQVRAFYYSSSFIPFETLLKSMLLFDEMHIMDRPSFTFICHGCHFGMVGHESPARRYEKAFRDEGFPLFVHAAPGGPVHGELLAQVDADMKDLNFLRKFQEGLQKSKRFRDLNIAPGNYGGGETNETLARRLCALDVTTLEDLDAVIGNPKVQPFVTNTPEGLARFFLMHAMECSAVLNYALQTGTKQAVTPLSDANPYSSLLGCKYTRAITKLNSESKRQVPVTDLSIAILEEVLGPGTLGGLNAKDVLRYRKESANSRETFLDYVASLQAKIGCIRIDADYESTIGRMIDTDVRPAAREYRNKLADIREKLFGAIAKDTLVAASSVGAGTAGIELFGDLSWPRLLSLAALGAATAGGFIGRVAIDALVEKRSARRECALSYLLEIDS
jgi:hypothetical protein